MISEFQESSSVDNTFIFYHFFDEKCLLKPTNYVLMQAPHFLEKFLFLRIGVVDYPNKLTHHVVNS